MQRAAAGWLNGLMGVVIFSASLPATRMAVAEFPPLFLTAARATIAAGIAAVLLLALRPMRPARSEWAGLSFVALGVVVGFPLLTALALRYVTAARSIVFIGLLPLMTALFAVLRGGEQPRPAFWIFACTGSALVAGFALAQGGASFDPGDLYMLAAIVACGWGYAEGARLSRHLGGWQVISWALVLSLPVMGALAAATFPASLQDKSMAAWAGLAYVSVFSMFVGFVFWYRGLALGGIAAVGQLQLLQPLFGLALATLLLGEHVSPAMVAVTVAVAACVFFARRAGVQRR